MTPDDVWTEYQERGRLSGPSMARLREILRSGSDPYKAITVAGDCGAFALAEDIATHLRHPDAMVRWNAAGVLFTRFRIASLASRCLEMVDNEKDEIARGVAITGLGELLSIVTGLAQRRDMARRVLAILADPGELTEMRGAAYSAVEAALGLPTSARVPATRLIDLKNDIDAVLIDQFKAQFYHYSTFP